MPRDIRDPPRRGCASTCGDGDLRSRGRRSRQRDPASVRRPNAAARHGHGQHARTGRTDWRRAARGRAAAGGGRSCACACRRASRRPHPEVACIADSSAAGRRSCARAPGIPPHPRRRDGHRGDRRGGRRRRGHRARSAARPRRRRARHDHAGNQRPPCGHRDPAAASRPADPDAQHVRRRAVRAECAGCRGPRLHPEERAGDRPDSRGPRASPPASASSAPS